MLGFEEKMAWHSKTAKGEASVGRVGKTGGASPTTACGGWSCSCTCGMGKVLDMDVALRPTRARVGTSELPGLQDQGDTQLPVWASQGHCVPRISPGCFGNGFLTDIQRMESIKLCSAQLLETPAQTEPHGANWAVPPLTREGSLHCMGSTRTPVAMPTQGASKHCWL